MWKKERRTMPMVLMVAYGYAEKALKRDFLMALKEIGVEPYTAMRLYEKWVDKLWWNGSDIEQWQQRREFVLSYAATGGQEGLHPKNYRQVRNRLAKVARWYAAEQAASTATYKQGEAA